MTDRLDEIRDEHSYLRSYLRSNHPWRDDIEWLLAEVERLQAERDRIMAAAKELLDREKNWHAEGEPRISLADGSRVTRCVDEYCTDWPCPAEKLRRAFEANEEKP